MVPLAPLPDPPSAPLGNRRRGFLVTLVLVLLALASAFLLWRINDGWENSYAAYGPTADNVRQTRQAMTQAFLLQVRRREDRAFNGPSVEALLDKAALKLSDAIAGESSLLGIAGHPPEGVLLKQLQEYQRVIFDLDQSLRRSLIAPRDATRPLSEESLVVQLRLFYEADRLGEQIETELTHGLARAVGNRLQEHRAEIALWGAVLLGALALVARLGRVGMAMARQERLIQAILDSTSDGVFVKDPQGRYRMANRAIAAMIGHAPGEILGHTDDALFPAATAQAMQRSDTEVMRERKLASFETIFVDPDGQRRTVWTTKGPLADDWGKIAGVYGISRDVTERKNAEQRLREREDQLQAIIDNINEGVVTFSLDGKVLSWNRAALAMHEFPPSASTTGDLEIFFELYELLDTNGTPLPPSEWPMSRIIRGEHLRDLEFTSRRRDGTWSRTFSCGGRLVMSAEGSPVMGVLSLADISERKRVETELRTSEARFKLFMDNSPSIAWIKDSAGRHVYCSRPFLKRLHLGPDDWQGRTNEELFPGEIGADLSRTDHLVLARGHALETDERTVGPDGEELYWRSIKFPFQDGTGDWFVGGMALDVTERRRAEEAQTRSDEVARERAEELEAVMQAAPIAILLSRDPSCREILGNRAANLLFDAAEGENLATLTSGRSYRRAGQDLGLDDLPMQQAVTQRREITIDDLEVTLPGGRPLLLMGGAAPLLGRNGQMRGAVGAFLDVTRQRQASEALEESNLRFIRIFHSQPPRHQSRHPRRTLGGREPGVGSPLWAFKVRGAGAEVP
ncbi:PAS domain-containing protein [Pararhodospirillum photometricum]|nr:PAS domain-containing protein [Pararhodospirillum photometricum]